MAHEILEQQVEITRHVSGEYFIRCLAEFTFQEPLEFPDDEKYPYPLELTEDPELWCIILMSSCV